MPSSQKITWAQLRVGLTALFAMVLLALLVFLITGNQGFFTKKFVLYTYMRDSAAVVPGAAVRLNGILVGEIDKVELSGSNDPARIVRMVFKINEEYNNHIPVDSIAAVSSENVLGAKFINIKKGLSSTPVKRGGEIKALDVQGFEEVVQQGYALLESLQGMMKRIDAIISVVEAGKGSIGKLLVDDELYNRLVGTVAEVQKIAGAVSGAKGTVGKLLYDDALYNDIRTMMARVDSLMLEIQQGQGTAGKLIKDPALYNEMQQTVAEIRKLTADLNAGKGSVGRLLKSEELHNQIAATLTKVDTMIDKLNSGQGTLGQLMVNPQLYDSMNGLTREMHELMKDFRSNPAKFLRVKVSLFLSPAKYLAVNADDFGYTTDVNAGIVDAHLNGILTSTTLMANANAFDDAIRLAHLHPSLDVGCHLVLIGGRSLLSPYAAYPRTVAELIRMLAARRIRVEDELRAQVKRIVDAGITPTHLDTHKHTHLLPPVLAIVARVAKESGIRWVRRPFDLPLSGPPEEVPWTTRAASAGMQLVRLRFHRVLSANGCRTTDYFAGFQLTGRFQSKQLLRLVRSLPQGTTEFMCHPGYCRDELKASRTRLKESRERELEALVDPAVRRALEESGVELRSYRELP